MLIDQAPESQDLREQLALVPAGVQSRFLDVDGIQTHYLEAGTGEPLLMIHSGEFGARAVFSWHKTIGPLAEEFHILAPDMAGFGRSAKIYDFVDPNGLRVRHLRRFMEILGLDSAHFMGSSFGASFLLTEATKPQPGLRMRSIVSSSGGGFSPDNDARKLLTQYDGSRDGMRRLLEVLVWDSALWTEAEIDLRWRASMEPGAWEAVAAPRFAPPGQHKGFAGASRSRGNYAEIKVPVLVVGGDKDLLREPGCWEDLHARIPGAELKIFSPARHLPHVEHPDAFNRVCLDFFRRHRTAG
jgi:pimeloyl-ACP methyl ester carboxylesterase